MESSSRLGQAWEQLSARERNLLILCVVTIVGLGTFIVGFKSWNAITDSGLAVETNLETLDLINRKKAQYLSQKGENSEDLNKRIKENKLKLTTHIDKEAGRFELKVDSFKESSGPVGSRSSKTADDAPKGTILEETVTVNIRNADYDKVAKFLDAIKRSRELIVIKRIEINRKRRSKDKPSVDVTLMISTFKTKSEG